MKILKKSLFVLTLICLSICFLYPLLYAVYYSILPLKYMGKIVSPANFTLDNYIQLFTNYPIMRWFGNTLIVTVLSVAGNIIIDCMAGYGLARLDFPGKNIVFGIVLASMMVPYQFIITPVYIEISKIGWADTLISLVVPFLFSCLFIFMARQFFMSIPKELEEAARVDGLSYASIFFRIVMPISGPLVTSIAILSFTGSWNSFMVPATFISSRTNYTLVVGLKTVKDYMFDQMNLTLAGVVLLSLPILIMFLILQKYFVEGIATTGIKG